MNFIMQNYFLYLNLQFLVFNIVHGLQIWNILQSQYLSIFITRVFMNKEKSHDPKQGFQESNKHQFIYTVDQQTYLFQTKDLFLQVQFNTLSKQIFEYLEQYHKYCFLSEISSIGIKASEQRSMFERISQLVKKEQRKYLQQIMVYIQQVFMNVQFMKGQIWHYYSQIVKGYRTNLLHQNNDCYEFNPNQFSYYKTVLSYLSQSPPNRQTGDLKKIKNQIKQNEKQIRKKINQINESMFVKNPFLPKNLAKKQIQSDQLFNSYFKQVSCTILGLKNSTYLNFHTAYSGIRHFAIFLSNLTLQGQKIANRIINGYNQRANELVSNIKQSPYQNKERKQFDIHEYELQSKKGMRNRSILRNKIEKVQILNRVVTKDEQKSDLSYIALKLDQHSYKYDDRDDLQTRIPVNNPYIDIWENIYDRDRLRKLQLFHEMPKFDIKATSMNRETKPKYNYEEEDSITKKNIYSKLLNQQKSEQQLIWKNEQNFKYWQFGKNKQRQNQIYEKDPQLIRENETKLQQQQRFFQTFKQYLQKYDKQKKQQQELTLQFRKAETNNPNALYLQYLKKFGIKDISKQCQKNHVYRYGIKIQKALFNNCDVTKLEEFLCNFLREKLYRENSKYQQRDCMPLILNSKPAEQFCNTRVIKKLGELTQSMKKYFVWACDIIKYEEIMTIDKEKIGKFTIYSYSNLKVSQSILFELKRRLNMKISGEIIQKMVGFKNRQIQCVLSKLQLMHRLIFNQFSENSNSQVIVCRGFHLFNLMMKQLSNDCYFEQK